MDVKGQPTAAAESSPRANPAAAESSPHTHPAAAESRPSAKDATDGGPPSKETGDGTAEGEGIKKLAAEGPKKAGTCGDEPGISGDEPKKPSGDEPGTSGEEVKKPGTSGEEAEKPGTSTDEPKKQGTSEGGSEFHAREWVARLGTFSERIHGFSTSFSRYHGNLEHLSQFLQRVATYAPDTATAGPGPAGLTTIARACGNFGAIVGHAAAAVQGATSLGLLLGATLGQVARLCGPEVVPVPEPEPKTGQASSSCKTKIFVSTVEQAVKVINWIGDDTGGVEVDVDLDVTPFTAIKIYEVFRSYGAPVLSMISGGARMKAKRAAYDKTD